MTDDARGRRASMEKYFTFTSLGALPLPSTVDAVEATPAPWDPFVRRAKPTAS